MKKAAVLFALFVLVIIFTMDMFPKREENISDEYSDFSGKITMIQEGRYQPLNYRYQKGMWFTSMDYAEILAGKTEDEFSAEVRRRFQNACMMGINTVYVQVRAFCDAYYPSDIFPPGQYYTDTSFDPLKIMISSAHALGMSFHAWINPLRSVTPEELNILSDSYSFVRDYRDSGLLKETDGRFWLDPSYSETVSLVCDGVREIAEKYNIDGIHIDDYFYPTTETSFDNDEFIRSGAPDIAVWRRENTSCLVGKIYKTVKSINPQLLFGISPQGNISQNMDVQYADVEKWTNSNGYCDYIVPQIYYGYENSECPYAETVAAWENMIKAKDVSLVVGLCTYKYGSTDEWAGNGADEWINRTDIVSKQTADILKDKKINGVSFYSYASTFENPVSSEIMLGGEIQEIRELLT